MAYAEKTTVSAEQTRNDIEALLTRHGATAFVYARDDDHRRTMIEFRLAGRRCRFYVPMPDPGAEEFRRVKIGGTSTASRERTMSEQRAAYDQAMRQRWRALFLIVKAKLEAVESGVVTLDQEFLAHTLLPTGQTVAEWAEPQVQEVYRTGRMPALLPGLEEPPLALPAAGGGQ